MRLKRKRYKLPTTLNTTAKDKAQKVAQQRLINNAARRIPNNKIPSVASSINRTSRLKYTARRTRTGRKPERSEGNQTQLPPLNPEERGMSGPEPPPSEARVSYSNHRPFPLILHPVILSARREERSPAGSDPVTPNTFTEKATSSFGIPFHKEFLSMPSLHSGCHPAAKVQLMRIPSIQNNPESSRQPQTP